MKHETFKIACELDARMIALQDQLRKWEKANAFEADITYLKENPNWSERMRIETTFMPFPIIKSVMIGTLSQELKELKERFDAL